MWGRFRTEVSHDTDVVDPDPGVTVIVQRYEYSSCIESDGEEELF